MNYIYWDKKKINAKNILAVKDSVKYATGCHRKKLNHVTVGKNCFSHSAKRANPYSFGGGFKMTGKIVFPCLQKLITQITIAKSQVRS